MKNFAITGGAGYIGSNLAKILVKKGHSVTIFDVVPKNKAKRLYPIIHEIKYKSLDIKNLKLLKRKLKNFDVVAHFAASADIALGQSRTDIDLKEGTIATYNVLEAMRENKISKIIFPSSSTIYGDFTKIPTPEDTGLLFPTSLYGASKLASEGLISAFSYLFNFKSWIFRFGNVVGKDMTRGVIKDFIIKLNKNPSKLQVLGNGNQKKDFIYIDDCINGILFSLRKSNDTVNVFNLGTGMTTSVKKIARWIINEMNIKNVKITFTVGKSGWPGDAPIVHYNINKIRKLGWKPRLNSDEAVKIAIKDLLKK